MRAILLAAGMGTRLRPLTENTPKSLVKVLGQPMIERQIEFLQEKGIKDIIVVVGYLKDSFNYLISKYGVKIIFNDKYDIYNNIYTMYLVRDYLEDSFVIDADIYMRTNFLDNDLKNSTYFTGIKYSFTNEWILRFDSNKKVYDIEIGNGDDFILSGVSYWTKKDGLFIREQLEKALQNKDFKNLYWDDIVKNNLRNLDIQVKKIQTDDWFEIDSLEDLKKAEELLRNYK